MLGVGGGGGGDLVAGRAAQDAVRQGAGWGLRLRLWEGVRWLCQGASWVLWLGLWSAEWLAHLWGAVGWGAAQENGGYGATEEGRGGAAGRELFDGCGIGFGCEGGGKGFRGGERGLSVWASVVGWGGVFEDGKGNDGFFAGSLHRRVG